MSLASLPSLHTGRIRLLLVRHGQSLGNQRNILDNTVQSAHDALTELGKAQSTSLGVGLRDSGLFSSECVGVAYVGSSSMHRAIETADLIAIEAFPHSVRLPPSDALVEISNGSLEGRIIAEVRDGLKETAEAWSRGEIEVRVGETGDSPQSLQKRSLVGLQSLVGSVPGDCLLLLVAAHFWVNRVLLAKWLGKELSQLNGIAQPNAGVSIVDIDRSDVSNGIVHLVGWQADSGTAS